MEKVAVIVTVLNEEASIAPLIDALKSQTTQASEIVIVDGGSIDSTVEIIKRFKKVQLFEKKGNRAKGRNYGVSRSVSPLIAFTDAGCIPHKNWLSEITKPFLNPETHVVSGYYEGQANNIFEKCVIPYVLVMPDQAKGEFFPSSRSMALRRSAWTKSGGFDENLSHNEDYAYAHLLKKQGFKFSFAANAIVTWTPPENLGKTIWMFMRFAIGDSQAGIIRPKVKLLAVRYYIFFFLTFVNKIFWLLTIPYAIWAILKNYKYVKDIRALFWLPILQITADIIVLFGTIVGLLSRIK